MCIGKLTFFFLSNLLQYWSLISICFEVYIVVSNFMESQQDLPYYTGIMTGDIIINSQLLGTSQNNPMSVSDSPPQFENVSSTKGKQGTNFSVEEGQVIVSV